jgi:hypothetical protein
MMERIEARLRAIGRARADAAIGRLAESDLPNDVAVERDTDGIILSGPGLAERAIEDVRLRGFALAARR